MQILLAFSGHYWLDRKLLTRWLGLNFLVASILCWSVLHLEQRASAKNGARARVTRGCFAASRLSVFLLTCPPCCVGVPTSLDDGRGRCCSISNVECQAVRTDQLTQAFLWSISFAASWEIIDVKSTKWQWLKKHVWKFCITDCGDLRILLIDDAIHDLSSGAR